jgi:hypothetical protein
MQYRKIHFLLISIFWILYSICHCQDYSLKFLGYGNSTQPDIDRVVIPLGNPSKPINVGMDFTLEFWMKANPGDNLANTCNPNEWYFGNVIIDRDVFGDGDFGDYGIVLCNRRIVVGVQRSNLMHGGVVGSTIVDDGFWHHVAVTRQASSGGVWLYIDGTLDASSASSSSNGNISYNVGRSTMYPDDPTLVFGAEKHDYPGSLYFKGKLDEFRLSNIMRYSSSFVPNSQPFTTDINTVALYHFNEGSGNILNDDSGAAGGPSHGTIQYGGNPSGPVWSYDSPFYPAYEVTSTADLGAGSLRQIISDAPVDANIVFSPSLQNGTIILSSPININKNLNITDFNLPSVSIEVLGSGPVFQIGPTPSLVVLKSFKIKSGNSQNGRCIQNEGTLRMENMIIDDLSPGMGSCILNTGHLEINGNVIVE